MMQISRRFLTKSSVALRAVHVEAQIEKMGLVLPTPGAPKGTYRTVMQTGNYLFLAGHLPQPAGDKPLICGKIGRDLTTEEGAEAAKVVGLNIIATLKSHLGDLDRVKRIVKLVGFVNCVDDFKEQPLVINGCSNLLGEVFGEKGTHARSAVGTNALPLGVAVEIEAIVEIE
jgi:enamine deaminase RidA (YjgF/YER057c/UK114 family)